MHAWSKCGGVNEEHSICKEVLKWGQGPQWTEIVCSSFEFKHLLKAYTTTSRKRLLILHAKQPMEYHSDQLRMKSPILVKDNTIVKGKSIVNHKDWHFRFHYQLIGKERKIYPAGGGNCCDILWTETLGWRITSTGILSWAITTCCEGLCSDPMLMMFGGGRGILTLCWGCETGLRSEPMVRGGILARCCCWGCETSLRSEPIVRGGILALCCCCCCWGCELGLSMFGAGILALCCSGSFPCATIIWR